MALPRESSSKEIDAALLSVISFPAFAVEDIALIDRTRNDILKKLGGKYGCKRFLRDGHQTVVEDTRRLHYEPHELNIFEGIECEWPLFFTYLILDGLFLGDKARADTYSCLLSNILVDSEAHRLEESKSHLRLNIGCGEFSNRFLPGPKIHYVPELYIVPRESLDLEKNNPGSQIRVPNENIPLVWAQSLFILGELIRDDLLTPGDLDPLGRRLIPEMRQNERDVVVQVVLLSESVELQKKLATFGLETQCMEGCAPITISQPAALRDAFTVLGEDRKLVFVYHFVDYF
jgi:phosphorylase kinase alpha/beta subunit